MKKQIKSFSVVICLFLLSVFAMCISSTTVQAAAKKGLVKEKGKYYYYVLKKDGTSEKATETWKTVKVKKNGKTISYKYYFGKNGAAYAGSTKNGIKTPAVKKIGDKYYGFGTDAKMLKGTYLINDKFYVFHSKNGVYDRNASNKLRKAYGYEKKAATLRKLLGKPQKTETFQGCYGNGKEYLLYYPNFILSTGENAKGVEVIFGAMSR